MADQVHPRDSPRSSASSSSTPISGSLAGRYVIQVPKDQIYRYPPPENALRQKKLSRKKPRYGLCCRYFCWTFFLLILIFVLLAATAVILYLIFRPEAPKYTVDAVSIKGFNLTSKAAISPSFDVSVKANNPNDKIGIYYETGSSVVVRYNDLKLCEGVLPVFYQPKNNQTIFKTELVGSNVLLSRNVNADLVGKQKEKKVPLKLNMKAPVTIKIGGIKTWTITVKVKCDLIVDSLTVSSKVVSKDCKYSVKLW